MKIVKNIGILFILVFSYILAEITGDLYNQLFNQASSYMDLNFISGFSIVYTFSLILFFTSLGDEKKYWWIGILTIPVAAFEVYFDLEHIYFSIALGLAGWLIAQIILKLKSK